MIKLLIVDDSALMRRQLLTLFQAEGDFEIHQARNGDEAVRENREFQPDVVSLDINMPKLDGYGFLRELRQQQISQQPAIMVSTEASAGDEKAAYQAGANSYLVKPVRQAQLLSHVRLLLGESSR
jgi:two-component system chemotaxis response regulator CheY